MGETMKVPARWTDDCQGKKDYDGELVTLSTRYWPRGGGFTLIGGGRIEENDGRPEIRPSAKATIYLGSTDNEFYDDTQKLVVREFEGETQEDVQQQVEAWAAEQFVRIARALRVEFSRSRDRGDQETSR